MALRTTSMVGLVLTTSVALAAELNGFPRDKDLVARSATAVAIAEAVAVEHFGEGTIASERPLIAERRDSVWIVEGTLKPLTPGGVVHVELSARDGRIVKLFHTK
jgi:NTF2 fold immunity protein